MSDILGPSLNVDLVGALASIAAKGPPRPMSAAPEFQPVPAPLPRLVAEALVGRHGPRQIEERACEMGLPMPAAQVVVAACAACSCDSRRAGRMTRSTAGTR